jgi:diguanylate cyclase (GGDEF)-like protein
MEVEIAHKQSFRGFIMKQKKMLLIASLSLWLITILVGVIQIPLKSVLETDTLGYSFYENLLVYRTQKEDTSSFFDALSQGTIPFEHYKDTDYAGSLTTDTFWFMISGDAYDNFVQSDKESIHLVEIAKPQLDHIAVYLLNHDQQIIDTYVVGRNHPYTHRPINHRNYFIPIYNTETIDSVIFQVKTNSYLQFPVTLWHDKDWSDFLHQDLFGNGLFYGAVFIMLIYNLILGLSIKDRNNIYFSLFILFFALMQGTWDGFGFQYLWPNNGKWDLMANPVSINLVSLSFIVFSANLLAPPNTKPLKKRVYQFALFTHFLALISIFFLSSSMNVYIAMLNASLTLLLSIVFLIQKGLKSRTEMIYLLAWQFFLGANTLNILAGIKLLPYTIITEISPKLAVIGLIALFSLALSEKFNTVEYLRGIEVEKRRLLKHLHDMHKKISSTQDIHIIFEYLLNMFHSITDFEEGLVVLLDQDLHACDIYSNSSQKIHSIELTLSEFDELNTLILKEDDMPLPFEDGILNTCIQYINHKPTSLYLIPLISLNQPIGFVLLTSATTVALDNITQETIEDFASQIAITLYNTKLFNKVNLQAQYDALTIAYNRRYFFELAEDISATKNSLETISVIMIDIDDFKQVNDKNGHIIGDIVLKVMVERIIGLLNKDSFIGRYGGEEFIILHHSLDPEAIHRLAHDILSTFRNEPISIHQDEKKLDLDITISIGLASSNKPISVYELTNRADAFLYHAKKKW